MEFPVWNETVRMIEYCFVNQYLIKIQYLKKIRRDI